MACASVLTMAMLEVTSARKSPAIASRFWAGTCNLIGSPTDPTPGRRTGAGTSSRRDGQGLAQVLLVVTVDQPVRAEVAVVALDDKRAQVAVGRLPVLGDGGPQSGVAGDGEVNISTTVMSWNCSSASCEGCGTRA